MSALTEAGLLREVARVQHDKTIQAVRDLIDGIKVTKPGGRNDWQEINRTAENFRKDMLDGLRAMREAADR